MSFVKWRCISPFQATYRTTVDLVCVMRISLISRRFRSLNFDFSLVRLVAGHVDFAHLLRILLFRLWVSLISRRFCFLHVELRFLVFKNLRAFRGFGKFRYLTLLCLGFFGSLSSLKGDQFDPVH